MTESCQELSKHHCSLSDPSPTNSATTQRYGIPNPSQYLRLHPLLLNRQAETKMAQMKEHIKAPEKIQLSNEEIANLSDAESKTLVIRMLTELIELSHKMKEEMKATQNEIKQNIQGSSSEGKETRTQNQ